MKTIIRYCLLLLLLLFTSIYSQSKVATTIGQVLKITPSARANGIGNASTSLTGEPSAAFYNPAILGKVKDFNIQLTHNEWLADINYNYVIATYSIESLGTFAFQVISLNSGEIDVRTVEQPLGTGERYSVNNIALGIGYGVNLTDRVSVGFQLNYLQETIWHSSLATYGVNFGVLYRLADNSLTLGASISNFGPRAKYSGRDLFIDHDFDPAKHGDNDAIPSEIRTDEFPLPTLFRVGLSYPLQVSEKNKLIFSADAIHPNDNNESINIGFEWNYDNLLMLRGGYRDLFLQDSEGGLVFGAGININFLSDYLLSIDYAWADYGRLKQVNRFTLGLKF